MGGQQGGREIPIGQERTQGGGPREGYRDNGYNALNDGSLRAPGGGDGRYTEGGRGLETAYRDGLRDLNQLRQGVAGEDAESAKEIQELIRQMQRVDPSKFPGNPALLEQLRSQLLPNLQQVEIQLRRKLEEQQGGTVRTAAGDSIPAGYADAVAEYFRKLSKGK